MQLVFAVVFCPCVLLHYAIMCLSASFSAHQSRVMMILFVLEMEWVLSTGQDKHFTWHCSESGQRLGGYRTSAGACGLQYPLLNSVLLLFGTQTALLVYFSSCPPNFVPCIGSVLCERNCYLKPILKTVCSPCFVSLMCSGIFRSKHFEQNNGRSATYCGLLL